MLQMFCSISKRGCSCQVCFWLWGKDNLVQLPKRTHRYVNSGYSLFFRGSNGVSQVFCDKRFINKAQFDAGFAHRLILKDGAVPAIKDPGHDSELQTVSETTSNDCFVGDRSKCSSLFSSAHDTPSLVSSAHTARLQELGFFSERIVNLYLSFINMIKLKTFWRYEGCSTTL